MPTDDGSRSLRVCVVGDSIATGTGDERRLGWHGRLGAAAAAAGLDLTIYDLGVRGDTTRDVATRWAQEVDARLPTVFPAAIVFQCGLNDAAVRTWHDGRSERRVSLPKSLETMRELLAAARPRAATLLIGPAPVDDTRDGPQLVAGVTQHIDNAAVAELDGQLALVAAEHEVPYLAVYSQLIGDPRWLAGLRAGDGIHPTGLGYDVMAELVAGWSAWRSLLQRTQGERT
jgi:lysophospholipase L1-like esterase